MPTGFKPSKWLLMKICKINEIRMPCFVFVCIILQDLRYKGIICSSIDILNSQFFQHVLKHWKLLFIPHSGKRAMSSKLQQSILWTVSHFMAFGQHNVWCESLSHCESKSPSTRGHKSQEAWTCNQSATVSGEGGDQSFMEASVFMAFPPAGWCSGSVSPSKW